MEFPDLDTARTVLLDKAETMTRRMRAVFHLRTLNTPEAVAALQEAYDDPSTLLQHELCYVLGQMGNPLALPFLLQVMQDSTQPDICRHEAAEAIGAIGADTHLDALRALVGPTEGVSRNLSVGCGAN